MRGFKGHAEPQFRCHPFAAPSPRQPGFNAVSSKALGGTQLGIRERGQVVRLTREKVWWKIVSTCFRAIRGNSLSNSLSRSAHQTITSPARHGHHPRQRTGHRPARCHHRSREGRQGAAPDPEAARRNQGQGNGQKQQVAIGVGGFQAKLRPGRFYSLWRRKKYLRAIANLVQRAGGH